MRRPVHTIGIEPRRHRRIARRCGYSTIEVLVAVFIFAFGGCGAATMQLLAAQSNADAVQRNEAVYYITDFIERIRNNPTAAESYDSSDGNAWTILGQATSPEPSPDCDDATCTPDCDATTCTPAQQAAHDLWAWERALDGYASSRPDGTPTGGLLQPTGCIRNNGNGGFEIAVAWYGRTELTNASVAPGCDVTDRYGTDSEYRRVVRLRTNI
jgi:type IV pilus assembly protein PilV